MKVKELPPVERLRELFTYDQEAGNLIWNVRTCGRVRVGQIAGYHNPNGYVGIRVDGIRYPAHRLIWKLVTGQEPPSMLDHIDLDKSNNRFNNLRPATTKQNAANRRLRSNNTSGFKGVYSYGQRWRAKVKVNQQNIHLGIFDTPEEAHEAYCIAAREHFGEFFCAG